MAYIPISDSPSAFLFGAGSVLLDFTGTYFHIDGGDEDLQFVRHVRKLSGLIVSAPSKNGLNSALQHNQTAAVPIVGHVPVPKSAPAPDSVKQLAHDVRAKTKDSGLHITTPGFTPKYEPTLLSMSLCSGKVELFVLDGGKKESMDALERAVNSGDEAAIEKAADVHGLILVVVWHSAKLAEPIKRVLYTGNASASRIIAALEKAESLSLLCVRTVSAEQAAKGVPLPARVTVRQSLGPARPAAARGATGATRPTTARAPAPRAPVAPKAAASRTTTTSTARPASTTTSRPSMGARPPVAGNKTAAPAKPPTSRTAAGPSGRLGSGSATGTSRGTTPITASPARREAPAQKRTVGASQGAAASRAAATKPAAGAAAKKTGPPAPTTPGRPRAAATGHGAATTPSKASVPETQPAPPTADADQSVLIVGSVPPVIVLGDSEDEAPSSLPNVNVVVIPPTPEPPVVPEPTAAEPEEPVATNEATTQPELPDEPITEPAQTEETKPADEPTPAVAVPTLPEPAAADTTADESVMFAGEVPAPGSDDSVQFVGETGPKDQVDTVPLSVPDLPATDATAPFEPKDVTEPSDSDATPTVPADESVQVINDVPAPVAPEPTEPEPVSIPEEFKEPILPQPVGDSGLLDDIEEPPRLMKISMDTDDLEKALAGVDLNDTAKETEESTAAVDEPASAPACPPQSMDGTPTLASEPTPTEEAIRKMSEQMFADAATPFTSALASSMVLGSNGGNEHSLIATATSVDQLIDTISDVSGPVQEAAHEADKSHHTMQSRSSLVSKQNGEEGAEERHIEYEQTDPAIDTVLDAVAADSEERDRSLNNGWQPTAHKENEKDEGEWKESQPFVSSNGPMMMTVTRNGGKPRLTRERYFELVTVPHKNGKCTLESLEEATEFFEGIRSSIYVVASEDLPMFVLEGCLAGKKAWKSAADMPCTLIPTQQHPNLQSFAATRAEELGAAQLVVRPAISHTVMTINTDEGPEDYHLTKVTL